VTAVVLRNDDLFHRLETVHFFRLFTGEGKEFIIKMEGNTGEFFDISGSEIHGGRCVQSIR